MSGFTPEALAEYIRCCTPENIHAVCEDYRAAVGIDLEHDDSRPARRSSRCRCSCSGAREPREPQLSSRWRRGTSARVDVRGRMLPCGHYPAEQCPEETLSELRGFFR